MWRVMQMLAWRSSQPALIRWLEASALFAVALAVRFWLGTLHGAVPFLTFYPAMLIAALVLGWKEATFVLVMSLSAGLYFFLPPGVLLLPAGYAFVGALNIAIIIALKALAQELAEANERQKLLFQELQHRVTNTLQSAIGKLGTIRRRMEFNPTEAINMLDETIERMTVSADIHRRLNDLSLFNQGLEPLLRDVVATVIDDPSVTLKFNVEELDLTLDQTSVIAMLVIETANNSLKHVFQRNIGSRFDVALLGLPGGRAILRIKDDGPGAVDTIADTASPARGLGMHILQGLVGHIRGTLSIRHGEGTEIAVEFPIARSYV
jgi:two-component system, sensor histidine kinase PdtaS